MFSGNDLYKSVSQAMNPCEGKSGVKSRLRTRAKNIVSRQNSGKENCEEEMGKKEEKQEEEA